MKARMAAAGGMILGASVSAGILMAGLGLVRLFRYSPYEDPGDLQAGIWLEVAAIFLIGIPVACVLLRIAVGGWREYRAWKRTLTPAERNLVALAEGAAAVAAHEAWRDRNQAASARLTESVMGPVREAQEPPQLWIWIRGITCWQRRRTRHTG